MTPTLFSGSILADGCLLDREFLGEEQARLRVLALLEPGVTTHAIPGAYVVCFAGPRRLRVVEAKGTPFLTRGHLRTTVDLPLDELARLGEAGALVLLLGGKLGVFALGTETLVRPSDWIDLGVQPIVLEGLGVPLAEPQVAPAPPPLRKLLQAHVPEAAPEMSALGRFHSEPRDVPSWVPWLQRVVVALRSALSWWGRARARWGKQVASPEAAPSTAMEVREQGRFSQWLDSLWVRLAFFSRLASLLQQRQWAYMENLLSAFARRDWDEALRHAIPLAKANEMGASQVSLAAPKPRSDLAIRPAAAATGRPIGFGPNLYAHLRALYQKAFENFDARGEHERAAFVLAELLGSDAEAAAYLERHGQKRLAAELAEARKLPPEVVVRQWLVAGDLGRAVAVARKKNAFPVAIAYLEKRNKELSQTLSLAWAELLAQSGSYLAAAAIAFAIPGSEVLAREWLRRAISVGGTVAAKALAFRLRQVEPLASSERAAFDALLELGPPDGPSTRTALASELMPQALTPWARTLARPLVRALASDTVNGHGGECLDVARSLAQKAGNRPLATDVDALLRRAPQTLAWGGFARVIEAQDTGARTILDVAPMPQGRVLVALGEEGLWLLHQTGRVAARFDVPAYRLVVSTHGDRVLALAPRGEATRLTRVDLVRRKTQTWTEAPIDCVAPTFDGEALAVTWGDKVYVVDALDSKWTALETFDLDGAVPVALALSSSKLCVVVQKGLTYLQRYDRPGGVLRARVHIDQPNDSLFVVTPTGAVAGTAVRDRAVPFTATEGFFETPPMGQGKTAFVHLPLGEPAGVAIGSAHVAGASRAPEGVKVVLRKGGPGFGVGNVELTLKGATRLGLRLGDDAFWVGDDRGRLLGVDLATMREVLDIRL